MALISLVGRLRGHDPRSAMFLLKEMHKAGVVRISDTPIELKAGGRSRVYVYGRNDVTENEYLLKTFADYIGNFAVQESPPSAGRIIFLGAQTAGTPYAVAAGLRISFLGVTLGSRMMRTTPKKYGAHQSWVDGQYTPDDFYVVVDNVITDGATKLEVIDQLVESGYVADELYHLVLIDRQQGGIKRLRALGHRIDAIFDLLDICEAFGMLELWTPAEVQLVRDEIASLQLS